MRDDGDEMAGMMNARKLGYGSSVTQPVSVAVSGGYVVLDIGNMSYPAGLTVAQARFLARKLYRMAGLLEQRQVTP